MTEQTEPIKIWKAMELAVLGGQDISLNGIDWWSWDRNGKCWKDCNNKKTEFPAWKTDGWETRQGKITIKDAITFIQDIRAKGQNSSAIMLVSDVLDDMFLILKDANLLDVKVSRDSLRDK